MTRFLSVLIAALLAAAPGAGQSPVAEVERVLSLGTIDGPPEQTFSRIVGVEVASTGEIVVADRGDHTIRVFSPRGAFLRSFGREGGGPSEFRWITATALRNDTLFVLDWRLQKVAAFTLDGALVATHRIDYSPGRYGLVYRMYALRDGRLAMESASGCNLPPRPGVDNRWWLLLLRRGGRALEAVLREDRGQSIAVYGPDDDRFCTTALFPFGLEPVAAVRPDGVVSYGTGEAPRVSFFQLESGGADPGLGEPIARVRLPGERRPVARGERERWLEREAPSPGSPARNRVAARTRDVLEGVPVPDRWPAYDRLLFDAGGGLWVRRPPGLDADEAVWDVYSSTGGYRGRARLPADLLVHRIRDDAVFAVFRDEWGVQHVVTYRVAWGR